jgi:hypothetical protein
LQIDCQASSGVPVMTLRRMIGPATLLIPIHSTGR